MSGGGVAGRFRKPLRLGLAEDLTGLVVEEALDLSGTDLPNLDLRRAVFKSPAMFCGARFHGLTWFQGAVFEASVDFSHVVFGSDARFDGVQFRGPAMFSAAQFDGIPCFDDAQFMDAAALDAMRCAGNLSLARTEFRGSTSLRDTVCEGGLWCDDAIVRTAIDRRGLVVYGREWLSMQAHMMQLLKAG